jgi:hypothetical protein
MVQVGSQKYRRMLKKIYLRNLASSQIWVNILLVDHLPLWLHHKIDPKTKLKNHWSVIFFLAKIHHFAI